MFWERTLQTTFRINIYSGWRDKWKMKGEKCFELFSFKAQICLQAFLDFEANTSKFDRLPLPQIFSNNIPNKNIFPSPINISTKKEHFLALQDFFYVYLQTCFKYYYCIQFCFKWTNLNNFCNFLKLKMKNEFCEHLWF